MRVNAELIILSKIYCFIAVLVLISSFAGCAAGSCLSYGHSCWGAHGKRNGPESDPGNRRIGPSGLASRWLFFSRMVNRQAALSPRSRPRMMPEMSLLTEPRQSPAIDNFSDDMNVIDHTKGDSNINEEISPKNMLFPSRKNFNNEDDQAINVELYKILKNIDDKLK